MIHKFASMEDNFFERLFLDWSDVYYTEPLTCFISLIAMVLGLRNYRKEKCYTSFILYAFSCFLLLSVTDVFRTLTPSTRNKVAIIELGNTLFEFIELLIFYYFFFSIIKSNFSRLLMKVSFVVFLFFIIIFFIKITDQDFGKNQILRFSTLIGSIKLYLLLIPIFTYFFEIFQNDPTKDIFHSPSLWITTGLFLYCLATLPFLLISDSLLKLDNSLYLLMFSIHFLSLSFLFLTIIKAFICKNPIIT